MTSRYKFPLGLIFNKFKSMVWIVASLDRPASTGWLKCVILGVKSEAPMKNDNEKAFREINTAVYFNYFLGIARNINGKRMKTAQVCTSQSRTWKLFYSLLIMCRILQTHWQQLNGFQAQELWRKLLNWINSAWVSLKVH